MLIGAIGKLDLSKSSRCTKVILKESYALLERTPKDCGLARDKLLNGILRIYYKIYVEGRKEIEGKCVGKIYKLYDIFNDLCKKLNEDAQSAFEKEFIEVFFGKIIAFIETETDAHLKEWGIGIDE
ncbi:MAG: hypothetical protein JXR73_12710 [Candidatus Omnitrophica bacterium]|nr:hypothetical protein [Candidatus Omnitrophota bacterium]